VGETRVFRVVLDPLDTLFLFAIGGDFELFHALGNAMRYASSNR
jgi:hypothetical protein